MKNNDKNFDENPKEKCNKRMSKINAKTNREYTNIYLCPLNKHDIVTSIDILDDVIIYGTIMGNVYLCRVDKNNLTQNIKKDNLSDSSNSISPNKKHINNKSDEISKISCIKLDENNNKSIIINNNNNEIKINKNNIYCDSDAYPKTKKIHNEFNEHEINTKRKLLNKNILENKNRPLDNSIINQNSLISKSSEISSPTNLPQFTQLICNAEENIPCLSFDTKDKINVAIGDSDIFRFENILENNISFIQIKNYNSENEHIISCEGAMCFMSKNNFLKLDTKVNDYDNPIELTHYEYTNKTIVNFGVIKGEIQTYNYLVPFDFDGDRLLCLDYESENIRRICIYYTLTKMNPFIKKINRNFGHISFMKFISDNKIILCRKNKFCEIRIINNDFKLVESWEHIGDEIIAMNVYIKENKNDDGENEKNENSMTELSYRINEPKNFITEYEEINSKRNKNKKNKSKYGFNEDVYGGLHSKLNLKKCTMEKEKINNSTFRDLININIKKQFRANLEKSEISIYNKKNDIQGKENITNELINKKNIDLITINNNEYFFDKEKKIYYPIKKNTESDEKNIYYAISTDHGIFVLSNKA